MPPMHELADLRDYVRFFITLIAVLDPFLAVPIYIGITARKSEGARFALARVVTLRKSFVQVSVVLGG